jgi:hypothetical protein
MRQRKPRPIRNTVDLADAKQVRVIKRRFRVSEAELSKIVDKIGNSIAAIGKQVALQRAAELAQPSKPQVAPVLASVSEPSVTVSTSPCPALQFQK